jgi:hypothetical protein
LSDVETLSPRRLNRTLLQRQLLIERVRMPVSAALEHLVGMQSQEPRAPYAGLWSRLARFDPAELSTLMERREAVRGSLMRATVHLVTAGDFLLLRPLLQPVLERMFFSGSPFGRRVRDLDLAGLLAAGRELLAKQPLAVSELARSLQERWPDADAMSLAYAVAYLEPVVQVTPRGTWPGGGRARLAPAQVWLGRPLPPSGSLENLVRRYLKAFGPASIADMQAWCGLTRLGPIVEGMRASLLTFRDSAGHELFDLEDATIAGEDLPAPARFLGAYDNTLLGHADRARIVSEEARKQIMALNGYEAAFLVDGFVRGTWRLKREKRRQATLAIRPLSPLSQPELAEIGEEAERLLALLASSDESRDVQFLPAE